MRGTVRALLLAALCFASPAMLAGQEAVNVRVEFSPRSGFLVPFSEFGAVNFDWSGTTTGSLRAAGLIGGELTATQEGAPFALALALDVGPNATIRLRNCSASGSCSTRVAGGELFLAGADALVSLFHVSEGGVVLGRIGAGAKLYRFQSPCAPDDHGGACSGADTFTRNHTDAMLRAGIQARWSFGPAAVTAAVTDYISVWGANPSSAFDRGIIQHDMVSLIGVALKLK